MQFDERDDLITETGSVASDRSKDRGKQQVVLAAVEDNKELLEELSFLLRNAGIQVYPCRTAQSCLKHFSEQKIDIALIDVGLPDESGLSLASKLRERYPNTGLIFLTARSSLKDRLNGYDHGADLYLVKPVDWRELLAQIVAMHRRIKLQEPARTGSSGWRLAKCATELVTPNGCSVYLTNMESAVMTCLASAKGSTVKRFSLIEVLSDNEPHTFDPHRLEVCIGRIRQKLLETLSSEDGELDRKQLPLVTVRGVGYRFVEDIHVDD